MGKHIHSHKKRQKPSVLFIPFGNIRAASSRLICYENAKHLKKRHWTVSVGKGNPSKFNVVVFQKRFSEGDLAIARKCRKVVFQLSEAYYLKGREAGILRFIKRANGIVVSTKTIQHWFKHKGRKSVVIPTGLDIAALPKTNKRPILTICWIGSAENERYLRAVVKPLNTLWAEGLDFEFRIIGGRKPHLPFKGKRHFIQWKLGQAERQVSECHIGIAPLDRRPLEFAKPPSKPTLYMAQDLAVVATDTPPYRELIRNGDNGFLVTKNDPKQWTTYLKILLTDKEKRDSFIAKGRVDCKRYDAPRIAKQWDKFLRKII